METAILISTSTWGIATFLELIGFAFWNKQKIRSDIFSAAIAAHTFSVTVAFLYSPNIWTFFFLWFGVFRIINDFRILKRRMHEKYLRSTVTMSAAWLATLQILAVFLWYIAIGLAWSNMPIDSIAIGGMLVSIVCVISTIKHVLNSNPKKVTEHIADKDLPTLTVALPVRNEKGYIAEALESILQSDYPKLEVLVLDDSSQDKTPQIVKDFAHKGVRFVRGSDVRENWLAKNQAYETLMQEASGQVILFCGVDVRFGIKTFRALITQLYNENASMISVLPHRQRESIGAAFVQPIRYWWEMAIPRNVFKRPSVLSTCWIVEKESLEHLGGFKAVARKIIPEAYFARELHKIKRYRFLRSTKDIDVSTIKSYNEQVATAERMRYPQVRRKPQWTALLSLFEIAFWVLPFILFLSGLFSDLGFAWICSVITVVLLTLSHVIITYLTNPSSALISIFNFPIVVTLDMLLLLKSMHAYEFGKVKWKGRDVVLPIMHVYPSLPKK